MTKKLEAKRTRIEKEIDAMRVKIAKDVARILSDRKLTQTQASYETGEAPSQISLVCTGKLRGFSLERLLRMRALLGAEVDVSVTSSTLSSISVTFG
jgi:predicted XRE-type DNA-binding protein